MPGCDTYRKITRCALTYGHRFETIEDPVCSPKLKLEIDRLVVGWVTTSEYLLLYVFCNISLLSCVDTMELFLLRMFLALLGLSLRLRDRHS